ncbi:LysR family transcriptional regulator [Mediterraneibacter butyricigenes]|uniref:LysR family transcriptional regulator n=1 Tax=Mediterraneibacter butyricigenes TaxID=2316025 RepID=A0A391P2R9_9FIRM|nr:LysR family transcriptional regulator [Mediterraneibacter butyricigenes]RGO25034.1 LysR family transcriptional regulator [Dorea sp. OM02-2LB]RGV98394.1 LysR family transcriptional regulator [Ruminococcus sp. AF14-10]GCA67825.1 LysR family transcriptional regulator [Mediterraneibacter butyricigenes]
MNLNQLQYFLTLSKLEHYTQAAKELKITQPSLSHAMSALEEELGTRLFEKRGRNVVLTKYGKVFQEYVEDALHTLDTGVRKTKAMTGQTTGVIDLAYIYTLGSRFVPQLVGDFLRSNEELKAQFHFTVGNTSKILEGLKEEKYDLAFCSRMEQETEIHFTPVAQEKLVVVTPKGHPLSEKRMVEISEAVKYPQVYFTRDSGLRPVIDKLFAKSGLQPKIAYEIEEDGAMAGLVEQNFGIAIMPDIPLLGQLQVEVLNFLNPGEPRYIYMAQLEGKYQPPMVEKFTRFVQRNRTL